MSNEMSYIPLETLAAKLGLPKCYLRKLARGKMIPYLNVNGRLRFNLKEVQKALAQIAASEGRQQ